MKLQVYLLSSVYESLFTTTYTAIENRMKKDIIAVNCSLQLQLFTALLFPMRSLSGIVVVSKKECLLAEKHPQLYSKYKI